MRAIVRACMLACMLACVNTFLYVFECGRLHAPIAASKAAPHDGRLVGQQVQRPLARRQPRAAVADHADDAGEEVPIQRRRELRKVLARWGQGRCAERVACDAATTMLRKRRWDPRIRLAGAAGVPPRPEAHIGESTGALAKLQHSLEHSDGPWGHANRALLTRSLQAEFPTPRCHVN